MPKLVLEKDGQQVDEHIISDEETLVGRSQGCDFSIADESVSREHLRIICILGDCFLEDLSSANGTLVNGRLTKKCALEDGDSIFLGQHEMKYDAADYQMPETHIDQPDAGTQPSEENDNLDATVKIDPSSVEFSQAIPGTVEEIAETSSEDAIAEADNESEPKKSVRSRTHPENPEARTGNLKVISGRKQGHSISLNKSVTGIDKGGKRIAAVNRRNDGYFLVAVTEEGNSEVRIAVNGEEIDRKILPLWSNDIIELGEIRMQFCLEEIKQAAD